jgi:large subunit ribosomal protein L35
MPKMKRHKGLAKRVKVTSSGKVKYRKSNMGHLMSGKGGARRRRLTRKGVLANKALSRKIATALQA